jgi:putative two-component system response regulator
MPNSIPETKEKDVLDVVKRMAQIAEMREPETAGHRERVRKYCYLLGIGIGLPQADAALIANASLLHDIGKATLPDELLMKTDNLTPIEWENMKRHASQGAELLRGSESQILQVAERIASTHHERWDGSGYPCGLRGEEIPLAGRICAVADVFDALTTRRPYKPEVTFDEAVRLIDEASGVLFDPRVVKAFVQSSIELRRDMR